MRIFVRGSFDVGVLATGSRNVVFQPRMVHLVEDDTDVGHALLLTVLGVNRLS